MPPPSAGAAATTFEEIYGTSPLDCPEPDALFIGSGMGLAAAHYLHGKLPQNPAQIVVAEVGPMDLITHMAHSRFPRLPVLQLGEERLGGRLGVWGVSAPRPRPEVLDQWPYARAVLEERFTHFERQLGVTDVTPLSDRQLQVSILAKLTDSFPDCTVGAAPLAIDRDGRRWSPLDHVPSLVAGGVRIVPRLKCTRLSRTGNRVDAVEVLWAGRKRVTLHPRFVVLAVGTEKSIPLVQQFAREPIPTEAADHHRIDVHGRLSAGHFGETDPDKAGIGVLMMDYASRVGSVPSHFEIKVAPSALWRRGYMQSSDNLVGDDDDGALYVQIQCVSAMAHRLPTRDLIHVKQPLAPVMRRQDAALHAELVERCLSIADAIGLEDPSICFRPLLANHHCYGAFRVGKTVTPEFRFNELENLFILPPSAFVDVDDDANPTLKSLVLSSFAMDAVAHELAKTT